MEQQKPSTDWPKRNNNLNGDEHLLRQNPVGDDSSLPKEERIPVDLISDYVISKINITETLTDLTLNGNFLSYFNENGDELAIDLGPILGEDNRPRITQGSFNNINSLLTLRRDDNSTVIIDLNSINAELVSLNTGNVIARYVNQQDAIINIEESVTSLTLSGSILSFTNELNDNEDIDLSGLISQSRIIEGAYSANTKILTLTRDDNSFIDVDLTNIVQSKSSIINTVIGNLIATHNNGDGVSVDINETITNLELNGVILSYDNEAGQTISYDLTDLSEDINLSRIISGSISGNILTLVRDDDSTIPITLGDFVPTISSVTSTNTGKTIAIHDDGLGNLTSIQETITNITLTDNILSYTNETGTPIDIDLSVLLDDTNLERIEQGAIVGTNLILTRGDNSTITIPLDSILDGSVSQLTDTVTGHPIAIHSDGQGNSVTLNETITDITYVDYIIRYTREDGTEAALDLTNLIDDQSQPFINSAILDQNTYVLTLRRTDTSTVTVDLSILKDTAAVSTMDVLISGSPIAEHSNGQGQTETIYESITSIIPNSGGTYTYINEIGLQTEIGFDETLTSLSYSGDTLFYSDENENIISIALPNSISIVTSSNTGKLIATHDNGIDEVEIFESITSLALDQNNLIYTKENGLEDIIDLTPFVGETLSRIESGEVIGNNLILQRGLPDETQVVIDISTLFSSVINTISGNPIATHVSSTNNVVINESITSLILDENNNLVYDKEGAGTDIIDLSFLLNSTIVSFTYNAGILTITMDDGSFFTANVPEETVTLLSITDNVITYINENNDTATIDLSPYVNNPDIYVESGIYDTINEDIVLTLSDASTVTIDVAGLVVDPAFFTQVITGNPIAIHNDGLGNETTLNETITTISILDDVITYTNEGGTPVNIDLSSYVNNTDLYLTAGAYNAGTITLTLSDNSIISIDVSELSDNTYVESGVFIAPNILRFTNTDTSTFDVDITAIITNPSSFSNVQLTGKIIARHNDGLGNFTDLRETITLLSINGNVISYVNENNDTVTVDLSPYVNTPDVFVQSGAYDSLTGIITLTLSDGSTVPINVAALVVDPAFFTDIITGHEIAKFNDGAGSPAVSINETVTNIGFNSSTKILTYLKEDGIGVPVDLSSLDSDNQTLALTNSSNPVLSISGGNSVDLSSFRSFLTNLNTNTPRRTIGSHNNGFNTPQNIQETITKLTLVGTTLTYTDENGDATPLTLPSGGGGGSTSIVTETNPVVGMTGRQIASHNDGLGVISNIQETITEISISGNVLSYKDENGIITPITLPNGGSGATSVVTETAPVIGMSGRLIAAHNDGLGNISNIQETVTELSISGNVLTYIDESGTTIPITLPSGGGGGGGLFDVANEGSSVAISSALVDSDFAFNGDGVSDFSIATFGNININKSANRRLQITDSITRLQAFVTTLTLTDTGAQFSGLPSYNSTALAGADTGLPANSLFRVSNNDGTSDIHIKTAS